MNELVKKAKKGNKEAFTQLIIEIENELYKIAKLRLQSNYDIDEAIQETMLQAFKSIKKLKHEEYFKTWIIRILINNCNKIYRKNGKKEVLLNDLSQELNDTTNNIEKIDTILNFYNIIRVLNYEERVIIVLYYMEDFTNKEISKILNMNENTVKSKLLRAKSKLKKFYKGDKKIWMN